MRKWLQINVACSGAFIVALLLLGSWHSRGLCMRLGASCTILRRPAGARVSTAVPPEGERLFGAPLRRVRLGRKVPPYEPASYRRCILSSRHLGSNPVLEENLCRSESNSCGSLHGHQ